MNNFLRCDRCFLAKQKQNDSVYCMYDKQIIAKQPICAAWIDNEPAFHSWLNSCYENKKTYEEQAIIERDKQYQK